MRKNAKATSGHQAVLVAAIAVLLTVLRGLAGAQPSNPDLVSARSHSGQFVVYAGRSYPPPPAVADLATNKNFFRLEPTLAAVSCERIKQELTRELGATEPWRGHIYVMLYPASGAADTITIASERFRNGWQYQVALPDVVERTRYVRGIVQVLLLELANRNAETRTAEIPLWLLEGFTQLLLASSEVEIILPPPRGKENGLNLTTTILTARKQSLQQQAQKKLRGRPPLTFENLSWPSEDELAGSRGDVYSGSAQLFVGELLRLPEGRACLREMLAQLPQNYNWQFAFLRAFHARFERPLDVEKWWALSLAGNSGRDLAMTWSREESWQKLDQATHFGVQVRTGTDELPLRASLKLQTVIREWDPARQTQALTSTMREVGLLRLRISREFVGLVQGYCETLQTYLQQRDHAGSFIPFTRKAGRQRVVEAAVQQLDALDSLRDALRPVPKSAATNQPPALPTVAR